ncbi:MAG: hypothetical protein WCP97_09055 [bacterium]
MNNLAASDFEGANRNFTEILKGNMLTCTIILPLVGSYLISNKQDPITIKLVAFSTVFFYALSVVLGMIQFFIDYHHAKNWGYFRLNIADNIAENKFETYDEYYKCFNICLNTKKLKSESSTAFMYGQLFCSLFGLIFGLILLLTIII